MITDKMITEAKAMLAEHWKDKGEEVIAECAKFPPLEMTAGTFLSHCFAQGGDWSAMLLTGLKELRPTVWDAIPDSMGPLSFALICYTLILCGVDTSSKD